MSHLIPDEAMLHAYVDGRLGVEARLQVEAFLARSPEWAGTIAGWKSDAEGLRTTLAAPALMPANPSLNPAFVRRKLRERHWRRVGAAAMILLATGIGGATGWKARGLAFAAVNPPMADAVRAYRVFAMSASNAVEVSMTDPAGMQGWLENHLNRDNASIPDLGSLGYHLVGGRLLATDDGTAAMVLFKDKEGHCIAYYMRPGRPFPNSAAKDRRDGGLLATYWSRRGYRYAVVAPVDDAHAAEIAHVLRVAS